MSEDYSSWKEDPFVCPKCGATSYHPMDKQQGYCCACHEFTGEVKVERRRQV